MRLALCILLSALLRGERAPIIDVHSHAGPGGGDAACAQPEYWTSNSDGKGAPCAQTLLAPVSDEARLSENLRIIEEWNITAITSGSPKYVDRWKKAGGKRIIPALQFELGTAPGIDVLRDWLQSGRFAALGEVTNQYAGIAPDDPAFEPYLALAEELDIPVGIHMGTGPPGAPHFGRKTYRARLGDPFLLEEALVRHPKLRVYVMHSAWPMADSMVAMLYSHPQLYVDTGVISWTQPRAEFHRFLQRLVDGGYGKRIMFGSDQMSWPDAIPIAIEAIDSAPFLSGEQKRDILYNNAVQFFRIKR